MGDSRSRVQRRGMREPNVFEGGSMRRFELDERNEAVKWAGSIFHFMSGTTTNNQAGSGSVERTKR